MNIQSTRNVTPRRTLKQIEAAIAQEPDSFEPAVPTPRLPRPVLLVKGGSSGALPLAETMNYLDAGPENSVGGIYHVDREEEFEQTYREGDGPRNIFGLEYSKKFGSFQHNATEIKRAIEAVKRVTGAEEIDVIAECKGAMEMRQYAKDVEEGQDGVRNLVMLVPPNHGLTVAGQINWLLAKAVEKMPFRPKEVAGYTADQDTITALSSFNTDWKIGPWVGNKLLRSYNSPEHVEKEKRVFDSITVVAGEGRNLLKGRLGPGLPLPMLRGDHAIPNWSAYLPHANNFFYDGERSGHGKIKSHPDALAKVVETLLTDGKPSKDVAYCDKQPGLFKVGARMGAWSGALVGRGVAVHHALTGASFGPAGTALAGLGAGLAVWDGVSDLKAAATEETGRSRNLVKGVAKFAQAAGVGLALTGAGAPAAALIGGGLLVSSAMA